MTIPAPSRERKFSLLSSALPSQGFCPSSARTLPEPADLSFYMQNEEGVGSLRRPRRTPTAPRMPGSWRSRSLLCPRGAAVPVSPQLRQPAASARPGTEQPAAFRAGTFPCILINKAGSGSQQETSAGLRRRGPACRDTRGAPPAAASSRAPTAPADPLRGGRRGLTRGRPGHPRARRRGRPAPPAPASSASCGGSGTRPSPGRRGGAASGPPRGGGPATGTG